MKRNNPAVAIALYPILIGLTGIGVATWGYTRGYGFGGSGDTSSGNDQADVQQQMQAAGAAQQQALNALLIPVAMLAVPVVTFLTVGVVLARSKRR